MSIQELGALGEFIGSIAVLVTLVYLAIQIRQNTRTIEESQRMSRVEAMVTRNTNMENALIASALSEDISDIEMRARTGSFDSLSDLEKYRLWRLEHARIVRVEAQHFQWENGYLDDDYYETQFREVIRRNVDLWTKLGIDYGRPSFREAIAKVLRDDA